MDIGRGLAMASGFWEPRRLAYNLVLILVVIAWLIATWPHFRGLLTLPGLMALAVLGILANLCYCAAYLVDIPMQWLADDASFAKWRPKLWAIGMLLAMLAENYWIADEMY